MKMLWAEFWQEATSTKIKGSFTSVQKTRYTNIYTPYSPFLPFLPFLHSHYTYWTSITFFAFLPLLSYFHLFSFPHFSYFFPVWHRTKNPYPDVGWGAYFQKYTACEDLSGVSFLAQYARTALWARLPASRMASHSRQQLTNTRPIPQKLSRIGKRPKSRPESCRKRLWWKRLSLSKISRMVGCVPAPDPIGSFRRIRNPLPGVWIDPNKV